MNSWASVPDRRTIPAAATKPVARPMERRTDRLRANDDSIRVNGRAAGCSAKAGCKAVNPPPAFQRQRRSGASADRRQFKKSNRKILTGKLAAFSRKPLRNNSKNREAVDGLPALSFAQPLHRQNPGQDGNDTAGHVRQRCDVGVKGRGEQRAENARQGSGTLRHADGGALFVRRREI